MRGVAVRVIPPGESGFRDDSAMGSVSVDADDVRRRRRKRCAWGVSGMIGPDCGRDVPGRPWRAGSLSG
jgi:hypothetical protein